MKLFEVLSICAVRWTMLFSVGEERFLSKRWLLYSLWIIQSGDKSFSQKI